MSVTATLKLMLNAIETLAVADTPAAQEREIAHDGWNQSISLSATSTPPIDVVAAIELTGASGTIDLTVLDQVAGTVDCTGKKLVGLMLSNPNTTGRVVLKPGALNPYPVNGTGTSDVINAEPKGGSVFYNDAAFAVVGGSAKNLDWTNAGSVAGQLILLFG